MSSSSGEFWSVPGVDKISDFLNRAGKNLGVQYALLAVLFIRVSWGMCETLQLEMLLLENGAGIRTRFDV